MIPIEMTTLKNFPAAVFEEKAAVDSTFPNLVIVKFLLTFDI